MNAPDDQLERVLRRDLGALAEDAPRYDPEYRRPSRSRKLPAVAVGVAGLAVVAGAAVFLTDSGQESGGGASCPNMLIVKGTEYFPAGDLQRMPTSAGLVSSGSVPGGCDAGADAPHAVDVYAMSGMPPRQVVIAGDMVWVNQTFSDREMPLAVQRLREPVTCRLKGAKSVRGHILSANSATPPRFDGDFTAPYTMQLRSSDPTLTQGDKWRWVIVRVRGLDETAVPPSGNASWNLP